MKFPYFLTFSLDDNYYKYVAWVGRLVFLHFISVKNTCFNKTLDSSVVGRINVVWGLVGTRAHSLAIRSNGLFIGKVNDDARISVQLKLIIWQNTRLSVFFDLTNTGSILANPNFKISYITPITNAIELLQCAELTSLNHVTSRNETSLILICFFFNSFFYSNTMFNCLQRQTPNQ